MSTAAVGAAAVGSIGASVAGVSGVSVTLTSIAGSISGSAVVSDAEGAVGSGVIDSAFGSGDSGKRAIASELNLPSIAARKTSMGLSYSCVLHISKLLNTCQGFVRSTC
jgi:hypothetical protein